MKKIWGSRIAILLAILCLLIGSVEKWVISPIKKDITKTAIFISYEYSPFITKKSDIIESFIFDKTVTYSHNNKGIFQYGYYFPNVAGAIDTVCSGVGNFLKIESGYYKVTRTITVGGYANVLAGSGSEKTVLICDSKLDSMINITGNNDCVRNLTIDTTQELR